MEVLHCFVGDERWTAATYCIDECALIKGLRADTTYRFRVSAINQFGQSPFSWASIEIRTKKKGTPFDCRRLQLHNSSSAAH